MKTFIIAEAGVNHNGSDSIALALVDAAADAGADAVKFQTFSADRLTRRGAEKAEYQERAIGTGDQYDMLKALEMSEDLHQKILARCSERNIEFMSTGFDDISLNFLVDLGIKRIKVPSGEITNIPFLRHVASHDLPIIVSTGMASMKEVETAVRTIEDARSARGLSGSMQEMVTVLHCTSNYPTLPKDVNLLAMQSMADQLRLPVGYSDHTLGILISVGAVALGAQVIEKHFTVDRGLPGPDHAASLEPDELGQLIAGIRSMESALGDGVKKATESEIPVRKVVRKSVTSVAPIAKGEVFTSQNLTLLRPGNGIPPAEFDGLMGRTAARDIKSSETLTWQDIE